MAWDLSCRDWQDRIRTGKPLIPTLPLIEFEADLAIKFFDGLRLPDVQGTPRLKEAAGDWFRDIVRALFGSWDRQAKVRHIEEIFALISKKNNKTTGGAAIMLTALLMNMRPRAEFLFVGSTQAISELAYTQATGMIELDPELKKRFQIRDHIKEIRDRLNGAKLKIKTFDLDILTGPRPAGVLLDELHLLGKNPHATKVIRQLRGGRAATPEGFLIILTTQSDDVPAGAFKDELATARAIRDGKQPGKMLPVIYEFPDDLVQAPKHPGENPKWFDSKFWPMVLPNLGRSLRLDALIDDFNTERMKGDEAIRIWSSQHLNIQIGLSLRSDRWAGADYWEGCGSDTLTLEEIMATSDICVAGIDGGGLDDLLGLSVIGRHKETKVWQHWGHAWAHKSVLERRKDIETKLLGFQRDGDLTIIEKVGEDVKQVADVIEDLELAGLLPRDKGKPAIGVDQIGIAEIIEELSLRNISAERIAGIPQGYKLTGAIKTAERKLAGGEFVHCGSALMAWNVGNAKIEPRGNAVIITKQNSGNAKIDTLMAMFDAVMVLGANPDQGPSVYEERGLLVL